MSSLTGVQVSTVKDRWKWSANSAGLFLVKTVKRMLKEEVVQDNSFVIDWCKWVPAKVNIHTWRMEMDRVPTAEALKKRNVGIGDSICPMCNSEEETVEHVFSACFIASNVWNGISSWVKIPNIYAFSLKVLHTFYKDLNLSEKKKDAMQGILMIVCGSLWRARNNAKFSNSPIRIDSILSEIKALGFLWFSNRSKHKGLEWREWTSFVNM
ncbi:uncharacterized protein LOC110887900 [Helianthus annuus]|uniref:uncharacterized protein LOC110887900 n=1 Tax=Helianthus annuus TaxID=4232 RepID=UPI000B9024AF|nr:uncharacterized protein LOC110887900 [Helianthus annuus]